MAGWQSGHAADCNSVYAGSIPTPASINLRLDPRPAILAGTQSKLLIQLYSYPGPGGEIGRHKGLKIPR